MKSWILAALVALCAAVGVESLRAAVQSVMTGPRTPQGPAAATAASQAPADQTPASRPPASPAPPPADATVAPDQRQSADNNVSFPIDI